MLQQLWFQVWLNLSTSLPQKQVCGNPKQVSPQRYWLPQLHSVTLTSRFDISEVETITAEMNMNAVGITFFMICQFKQSYQMSLDHLLLYLHNLQRIFGRRHKDLFLGFEFTLPLLSLLEHWQLSTIRQCSAFFFIMTTLTASASIRIRRSTGIIQDFS